MIDVVSAVIVHGPRLLLTQRPRTKDFPFVWECPGGKVEAIESSTPRMALQRELYEELGIVTARIFQYEVWSGILVEYDIRISFYEVHIDWASPPTPKEGQGLGYFRRSELAGLPMTPGNQLALPTLLSFIPPG